MSTHRISTTLLSLSTAALVTACGQAGTFNLGEACSDMSADDCQAAPECELVSTDRAGLAIPSDEERAGGAAPDRVCTPEQCPPPAPKPAQECVPTEPSTCPTPRCGTFCPYGQLTDANGCPACGCKPEPSTCAGKIELHCVENASCQPIYEGGAYSRCDDVPSLACEDLGEAQCLATQGCSAVYEACSCLPCDPNDPTCGNGDCACPDAPWFAFCEETPVTNPCNNLTESQCIARPDCEATYTRVACLMAPPCDPSTDPNCGGVPQEPPCPMDPVYDGCSQS